MLMCLVALEDPGPDRLPHASPRARPRSRRAGRRLREALRRDFEIAEVPLEQLAPQPGTGPLQLGYIDAHHQQPYRLTLKDQSIADAALAGLSEAYRSLDTGVLEALLLKGALGYQRRGHLPLQRPLLRARRPRRRWRMVRSGEYDAAFLMRPTPVEQVREVAAAGENMPPKSTYFFPKLLTGLLFNPLSEPQMPCDTMEGEGAVTNPIRKVLQ